MTDLPPQILAVGLAAFVAVVGMPHGGLDHLFGRELFRPGYGRKWPVLFLPAYLGVAGVVLAGWFLLPTVTVVLFFLLSAWHFGDDSDGHQPANVVEGGMVIWIPLLFRPAEVAELLAWVIPEGDGLAAARVIARAQPLLWALLAFFAGQLAVERTADSAGRKVAFALLFAVLPTLVSFTFYFCGWHSTRELAGLARQADPNRPSRGLRRVLLAAAPTAVVAVAGTAIAAWVFAGERKLEPVLVQAVFLGLSAVAVPHILLQAAVRQRGVNPFQLESVS
jgi:beta-carotene 15,15'-dioxygenase